MDYGLSFTAGVRGRNFWRVIKKMSTTIYATFPTDGDVERAVGALLDHGVPATAVSLVAPERLAQVTAGNTGVPPPPPVVTTIDPVTGRPNFVPADIPIPDVVTSSSVQMPGDVIGMQGALVGQPEATRHGPTEPLDEIDRVVVEHGSMRITTPEGTVITAPSGTPSLPADTPEEVVLNDSHAHIVDMHRGRPTSADGLSTTTAGDAGKGALEGTGIGLGVGILLGLATIAIPGVGFVAGSGALVAGLAAATGAAGGVTGLVYGYLVDLGVSPDHARHLTGHLDTGGPILAVALAGPLAEAEVMDLLNKYGATSVQAF